MDYVEVAILNLGRELLAILLRSSIPKSAPKKKKDRRREKENSEADDSCEEIYLFSDDEVEVIPYKKTPPEVLTLNEDGEIVPEDTIPAADLEKLNEKTSETLATILKELKTCNDANQMKEFHTILLDIQKKLKTFSADSPEGN